MAEFVRRRDCLGFVWGISMGNYSLVQEKKAVEILPWAISGGSPPQGWLLQTCGQGGGE